MSTCHFHLLCQFKALITLLLYTLWQQKYSYMHKDIYIYKSFGFESRSVCCSSIFYILKLLRRDICNWHMQIIIRVPLPLCFQHACLIKQTFGGMINVVRYTICHGKIQFYWWTFLEDWPWCVFLSPKQLVDGTVWQAVNQRFQLKWCQRFASCVVTSHCEDKWTRSHNSFRPHTPQSPKRFIMGLSSQLHMDISTCAYYMSFSTAM